MMNPHNVEAYAPLPARHVAAVLGREPASGLNETRPRGQVGGPAVASLSDITRPCGLARAGTGPAHRRRAARKVIAAGAKLEGAGRYPGAPSALPRDPTRKRCGGVALHIGAACWRARLYGAGRWPGLAGHPVGPVIAPHRRGRAARLGLPGRTLRGPPPSAAPRPFASASAPGGRASSLAPPPALRRPASDGGAPSPALRGPGFLPGPLPRSRPPPAAPEGGPPDLPR